MRARVEYLTRSGCSLCEQTEPTIRLIASLLGVALETVDIDRRSDLAKYHSRVPVLISARGTVLAEGIISRSEIVKAIARERFRLSSE